MEAGKCAMAARNKKDAHVNFHQHDLLIKGIHPLPELILIILFKPPPKTFVRIKKNLLAAGENRNKPCD